MFSAKHNWATRTEPITPRTEICFWDRGTLQGKCRSSEPSNWSSIAYLSLMTETPSNSIPIVNRFARFISLSPHLGWVDNLLHQFRKQQFPIDTCAYVDHFSGKFAGNRVTQGFGEGLHRKHRCMLHD